MRRAAILFLLAFTLGCAITKVETSKTLYTRARTAQESGKDLEAIVYWKAVVEETAKELNAGHYPQTNRFLRASALLELGQWDLAFQDLKQVNPEEFRKEEYWIYPLYAVLMGDYYAQQGLYSVAANFYESVLKQSSLKTSSVYLLALERQINNSIQKVQRVSSRSEDQNKAKIKEYEALSKVVEKYLEEIPYASVPHYLMADLLMKLGRAEESMEHLIASLEIGLPTVDLRRSAEFEIASLLTDYEVSEELRSLLLKKGRDWWSAGSGSVLLSGSNTAQWIRQQEFARKENTISGVEGNVRYLAIANGDKVKILIWERE